jgi:hypothetical protein
LGQGAKNYIRFRRRGRGRRIETYDDQKKETNVRSIPQLRTPGIPHHTKTTTTSGGSTTTSIGCKTSKPKTSGQTRTIVGRSSYTIGSRVQPCY